MSFRKKIALQLLIAVLLASSLPFGSQLHYVHASNQEAAEDYEVLANFHGQWKSVTLHINDSWTLNIDSTQGLALLSSRNTRIAFFPLEWETDNNSLILSMNDEANRAIINVLISDDKTELFGTYTQYNQTSDISFTKVSDVPETGEFRFVEREQKPISDNALPEVVREIVNRNREIMFPPVHPDIEEIISNYKTPDLDPDRDAVIAGIIKETRENPPRLTELTHDQITDELNDLFALLKLHGEGFVESVEVYDPLLEALLETLSSMDDPLNLETYIDELLIPYLSTVMDAGIAQMITGIRPNMPMSVTLSHDQIIEELSFLFDLLRHGYGAYQYAGGTEVFEPLKELMLEALSVMDNPLSIGEYLNDLLLPNLRTVIEDNHAWIGQGESLGIRGLMFMNQELIITKRDGEPITEISGQLYKLVDIINPDGESIEGLIPTLTYDGEVAWAIGYFSLSSSTSIEVTLHFENIETNEVSTQSLELQPLSNASSLSDELFEITESAGITILTNRRLHSPSTETQFQEFVNTGEALREESVLILDLRGHGGGNDFIAWEWVAAYAGEPPEYSMLFANVRLNSLTTNAINFSMPPASPPEWDVWFGDPRPVILPSNNLVIVLTDNAIGSAGDTFVGYMRQLENVLIVGANTSGTLVTGNVGVVTLPISGLDLQIGTTLNIRPNLSQFEGIGFKPDLWVDPNESLERVIRFIQRY